jgi:hypothetical protein
MVTRSPTWSLPARLRDDVDMLFAALTPGSSLPLEVGSMQSSTSLLASALALVLIGGLALVLPGGAAAEPEIFIVVPAEFADVEADSFNNFPFSIGGLDELSQRYQQVYAASEFSALAEPGLITALAFRLNFEGAEAFSVTLGDVQINLSATSAELDALSNTFANNVGLDDAVVFAGPLLLSSAFSGPAEGPKDFDVVIELQQPFLYDPSAGNLLLDVRNFTGGISTRLDASSVNTDTISRVQTNPGAGAVDSPTGFPNSQGLVTSFTVPEPSATALELAALGILAALFTRRGRWCMNPKAARISAPA